MVIRGRGSKVQPALKRSHSHRTASTDLERAVTPRLRPATGEGITPRKSALKRANSGNTLNVHATTMPPALSNTMAIVGALKAEREERARRAAEQAAVAYAMFNHPLRPPNVMGDRQPRRQARVYFGETLSTGRTQSSEIVPSDNTTPRSQLSMRSYQSTRSMPAAFAAATRAGRAPVPTHAARAPIPMGPAVKGLKVKVSEQGQRTRATVTTNSPRRHPKLVSEAKIPSATSQVNL
jgi:hypothetical protein